MYSSLKYVIYSLYNIAQKTEKSVFCNIIPRFRLFLCISRGMLRKKWPFDSPPPPESVIFEYQMSWIYIIYDYIIYMHNYCMRKKKGENWLNLMKKAPYMNTECPSLTGVYKATGTVRVVRVCTHHTGIRHMTPLGTHHTGVHHMTPVADWRLL